MRNIENKKRLILENKNMYKSIIILALPIFLSNMLKSIHSFVDAFFVSPLGDYPFAAIIVTNPIISITQALAIGFMIAGGAIMSQSLGAKNVQKAKRTAGQLLTLCIICGIIFNIILYTMAPMVTKAIGAEGETLRLGIQYVRIRSFEMIPLFAFYAFLASRQASGDTITPVIFDVVAILTNILLTGYFVKVLGQGLAGAAIATVIANYIIMPVFLWMMFKDKKAEVTITLKEMKLTKVDTKQILSLGLPSALSQAFSSLGFLIINALILSYGAATVSGFGIGNSINNFVLMPAMGVGGSIATFVGQNIGAKNPKRAKESVKCAMILTLIIMIIGGAILLPIRRQVGMIFPGRSAESLEVGVEYMFFLFTSLPLMAIFQVFMGAYQGAGYTIFSLLLASFRLWGMRIPLVFMYRDGFNLDSTCIMYAMVISNFGAAILGLILYKFVKFDKRIVLREEEPQLV
jgi:putative MATE family efflux protein